jgi:hypothetical protein
MGMQAKWSRSPLRAAELSFVQQSIGVPSAMKKTTKKLNEKLQ